ncbi:MAG TPA: 16S rRNA (guanine(527)-N(7))-methyltransferase RsmG [Phycisphaerae bacterium]|nr:16S rRNA (guanine(527)-N(7))-methyltransferase RsmG [Phycisphaerae bacterium]
MVGASGLSERAEFEAALVAATRSFGLRLDAAQQTAMWIHFERMVEANRRFNLTRITGETDAAVKHYADSLSLLAVPGIERTSSLQVVDVGTGAGFPAVPLSIVCPTWKMTAIDGTGKKVRFVAEAAEALGLRNLLARHARGAELALELPGRFDLVLLRAVGKMAASLAEVRPLVRPGGKVVFYKTTTMPEEELADGCKKAAALGCRLLDPVDIELPAGNECLHRRFVVFERPRR